jgi:prolipoprotein diacylglyceryltransferase
MSHFWLNLIRIVYIVVAFLLGKDSTSCNFLTYFMYTMLRYPSFLYNRLVLGSVFIFIFIFFYRSVDGVRGVF